MRVLVLSPHLDDAVMSLGATMSRVPVDWVVATLFAGNPLDSSPPSEHDTLRGLKSAGATALARRSEDAAACSIVGARPVWGNHADSSYFAERDPDQLWDYIEPLMREATLTLIPGWPLVHVDHAYLTNLVLQRSSLADLAFYCELPYAASPRAINGWLRGRQSRALRSGPANSIRWMSLPTDRRGREAKQQAVKSYAGEMPALGRAAYWASLFDHVVRREFIGVANGQDFPHFGS